MTLQPLAQPPNQLDYLSILTTLTDDNSDRRRQAETTFASIPAKDRFSFLGSSLCQKEIPEQTRILAAILLRRLCIASWPSIQGAIEPNQLRLSCNELLGLLEKSIDDSKEIREKISQVIAATATSYLQDTQHVNPWTEFVQFLFQLLRSPNVELRIAGFIIISNGPDALGTNNGQPAYMEEMTRAFMDNVVYQCEWDRFFVELVSAISRYYSTKAFSKASVKNLSPLAHHLIDILNRVKDDESKEKICQDLIEIAEEVPLGLRAAVSQVLQSCLTLMNGSGDFTSDDLRLSALELAVSLIENAPIMVKKRGIAYIKPIILKILAMMTELDDDPDWHTANSNDKDEDSPDATAESALDRISNALGGKVLLPILIDELTAMLQRPDWQARHAALMALSSAGEGCREQLKRALDRVVTGIIAFLADPHPRVRHAACNAIGQMATDFAPDFETKFHSQVIPPLCRLIVDNQSRRVQAHAACAMINLFEECQQDVLITYLDMITEHIQNALNQYMTNGIPTDPSHIFVLESIFVALSSVADASAESFAEYYGKFMPGLKYIISNSSGKDELRLLRGKAIECVSLIGMAVGKEVFCKDGAEIMQILLAAQTGELKMDYDDPQLSYMMAAWARICRIMGPDFQAYLPYVMGPVLETAALKVEIALLTEEDKAAIKANDEWESVSIQDQAVGIRTAGLEDKATACSMLVCYARELKHGFVNYVEKTAEVLVPLLKFPFHDDVKCAAAEAMPYLLESAEPRGQEFIILLWTAIFDGLMGALARDSDNSVRNQMLDSLAGCIKVVGKDALTDEQHEKITLMLIECFNTHFNELAEEIERRKDEDYESESECSDEDQDCLSGISALLHSLFVAYGPDYLPYFKQIVNWLTRLTMDTQFAPLANKQTALYIWSDVIEFSKQGCAEFQQVFLPLLSSSILDKNKDSRQAALYSIGQLAQSTGSTFAEFFNSVIPTIFQVINHPESRSDECIMATENGISAICRILQFCPQLPNHQELLKCWFDWLPIYSDDEEVPVNIEFLLKLVEQNNPTVMGVDSSSLQRIVAIIAEPLAQSTLDANSEVGKKAVNFLQRVHSSQPPHYNFNALTEMQQKAVMEVLKSA